MPIRGGGGHVRYDPPKPSPSGVCHLAPLQERSTLKEQNSTEDEWFDTDQNSEHGALLSTISTLSGITATTASTSHHAGRTNHYQLENRIEEQAIDGKVVSSPPKPSEVECSHGDDLSLSVTEGGGGLDGVVSSPPQQSDFEIPYNDEEDHDEKDLRGKGEAVVDDKAPPDKDENEGIDPDSEGDCGDSPDTRLPVHDVAHEEDVDEARLKKRQRRCIWVLAMLSLILALVVAAGFSIILTESPAPTPRPTPSPTLYPTPSPTPNPTPLPTPRPTLNPTPFPSSRPTLRPTPNPTVTPTIDHENAWIALIQSRMPSVSFFRTTSPQRRALNWMVQDSYTLSLTDDDHIVQRFALAVLYYATNGPSTWDRSGWLESWSECGWGGDVACVKNVAVYVNLPADGLSGSIPREIGLLSALTYLSLQRNDMSGSIPTEIGLLSALTVLSCHSNDLSGSIPTEIGLLHRLTYLDLSWNSNLRGLVPTELANLESLLALFFEYTDLSGSIPSNLCGGLLVAEIDCGEISCNCCTSDGGDFVCR